MKLLREYWFIILGWPILAAGISWFRLGGATPGVYEWAALLIGYLLVGLASAYLLNRILNADSNGMAMIGYSLGTPIAYFFGLVAPNYAPFTSLPAPLVYLIIIPLTIGIAGAVPLLIGTKLGSLLDRRTA